MSFGNYDHERRYRRRVWGAIIRIGFYLSTLVVVGIFAYQTGIEQIETREGNLRERIEDLDAENRTLTDTALALEAQARTAEREFAALQEAYARDVPTGDRLRLLELVSRRLEDGVGLDRLAFYINAASAPQACSEPTTRRFILPTPAYSGANTSVAFADGRITITGDGQNATTDSGGILGWFDPAQPVSITFTRVGGEAESIEGMLPIHHSLVMDEAEYRFTITEGDRSLVNVTGDRCDLLVAGADGQGGDGG